MKLVLKNVGTGFLSVGRGTMATGPILGMTRQSEIQISPEQFTDYEYDIRYYHTAKSGEVKLAMTLDGELATPDEVAALIAATPEDFEAPPADINRKPAEKQQAAVLVAGGLVVNYAGAVDTDSIAAAE